VINLPYCTFDLSESQIFELLIRNRIPVRDHTTTMSAATKDALSQADIIFNRTNVALARSQRLIASWLPPKPESENQESTQAAADEDEDFRGDSEIGGIGSRAQKDDSGLPEGAFKRRNPGANDKLLDSLLGKKAANAHRKAQALAKSATAQPQDAPKPAVKEKSKRPAEDSDSEDEGGRAAAFKSKRAKPSKPQPKVQEDDAEDGAHVDTDMPEAIVKAKATELTLQPPQGTKSPAKSNGRKRPASYLDELLGQKANKKNKKKNKSAAGNGG